MARSSAEDMELRRSCAVAIAGNGGKEEEIVISIRVAKGRGIFEKLGRLAEPRVLAVTTKLSSRSENTKAFIRVLKYSSGAGLEPAKQYKLKHLTKLEVVANDPSGCTFFMGFDNLRSHSVAPPQWTMCNIDDRNRLLFCMLNLSKEIFTRLPKVVGIDIVELALWAKDNTPAVTTQVTTTEESNQDGATVTVVTEREMQVVSVEKDLLVSHAEEEEEDMESMQSLLGMYLMGIGETEAFSERMKEELLALEATNVYSLLEVEPLVDEVVQGLDSATFCIDDIDEWLQIINVKLRHMREDIASIESRNNTMELLSDNCKGLVDELDRLLNHICIPPEYSTVLTAGSFEEKRMLKHVEACEWLSGALRSLEASNIEPCYANMRAIRERHQELEKLKAVFVKRALDFLRNYFSTLADFMLNDKNYFAQFRGQLKRPDHSDLRFKCRTYARLLQHLKSLDRSSLMPLRKAYCQSLNLLLRREAREFSNELRSITKTPRNAPAWLEGSVSSNDTSMVSEAYSNMLKIFIPLLVDESSFFAHFMCFDGIDNKDDDDDLEIMDIDGNDDKPDTTSSELNTLNEALKDLLDGIQEDFYAIIDWAWKVDPLRCISMYGVTERYLSGQKTDAAGFVHKLLDDLRSKIVFQFNKFIEEICHQIERNERNIRPPIGVLSYMTKFENLASRMEQNIQGQSRDMVDKAYSKLVGAMFQTLEKIAETDSKSFDIVLIENYAAFQNSLFELANVVPGLAMFYHLASENYEQACTRLCNFVINIVCLSCYLGIYLFFLSYEFDFLSVLTLYGAFSVACLYPFTDFKELQYQTMALHLSHILVCRSYHVTQSCCYCNGTEWCGKLVILAIQSIENTSHDILFLFFSYLFLGKQFEKLISFHQKVDDLRLRGGKSNDEIPFQQGLSKADLRKVLKHSLTGIERSFNGMNRKLQKSLSSQELLPSLWDKCKKEFLAKYAAFVEMVLKIYGNEPVTPVAEMKQLLAAL